MASDTETTYRRQPSLVRSLRGGGDGGGRRVGGGTGDKEGEDGAEREGRKVRRGRSIDALGGEIEREGMPSECGFLTSDVGCETKELDGVVSLEISRIRRKNGLKPRLRSIVREVRAVHFSDLVDVSLNDRRGEGR